MYRTACRLVTLMASASQWLSLFRSSCNTCNSIRWAKCLRITVLTTIVLQVNEEEATVVAEATSLPAKNPNGELDYLSEALPQVCHPAHISQLVCEVCMLALTRGYHQPTTIKQVLLIDFCCCCCRRQHPFVFMTSVPNILL